MVSCLEKVTLRKFSISVALPMIISLHLGQSSGFNPDLMMVKYEEKNDNYPMLRWLFKSFNILASLAKYFNPDLMMAK